MNCVTIAKIIIFAKQKMYSYFYDIFRCNGLYRKAFIYNSNIHTYPTYLFSCTLIEWIFQFCFIKCLAILEA